MKAHVKRMKRPAAHWEKKCLQTTYWVNEQYLEYIESPQNSIIKNKTIQLENGQATWTDTSLERIYRWQ